MQNLDGKETVPQIILCMGAATVEAVPDEKFATRKLDDYNYIVFHDEEVETRLSGLGRCVDVNWVKDCLVSGRLLPRPPSRSVTGSR